MKIVLVEDDSLQLEAIQKELKLNFPESEILAIENELNFKNSINDFIQFKPDIFIVDILLRWTDPQVNMEMPPIDSLNQFSYYEAGFRCQKYISEHQVLNSKPFLLYTVLSKIDIKEKLEKMDKNVMYLPKGNFRILIDKLKKYF